MSAETQDHIDMMIVKLTKTFPIRVTEWLLAGIMLSWSLALWTFTPQEFANPIYIGLARIADNNTWAFFAFWIAVIRLAALLINGAWRPSPHLRAGCAFLACFMWSQIALGQLAADQATLGIAIYPWLLLADIYNVFRASHDARISDESAKARVAGVSEGANATAA